MKVKDLIEHLGNYDQEGAIIYQFLTAENLDIEEEEFEEVSERLAINDRFGDEVSRFLFDWIWDTREEIERAKNG